MSDVRVLVVDQGAPSRRTLSATVEATDGFEVVGEIPSGEQCMVAASHLLPDLVLMEIDLPGMDGLEATSRLRARPVARQWCCWSRPVTRRLALASFPGAALPPTSRRRRSARTGSGRCG